MEDENNKNEYADWKAPYSSQARDQEPGSSGSDIKEPDDISEDLDTELKGIVRAFLGKDEDSKEKLSQLKTEAASIINNERFKQSGLQISAQEISDQLDEALLITDEQEQINQITKILSPLFLFKKQNLGLFERIRTQSRLEKGGYVPVNEVIYYGIHTDDLHIHLADASDFGVKKKIRLMKDGLRKIAQDLAEHPEVKKISATAWIVASNPGLMERLGFDVQGEISDKLKEAYFKDEQRPVSRAVMSREEFLKKYG
jgi:hypothetical protein